MHPNKVPPILRVQEDEQVLDSQFSWRNMQIPAHLQFIAYTLNEFNMLITYYAKFSNHTFECNFYRVCYKKSYNNYYNLLKIFGDLEGLRFSQDLIMHWVNNSIVDW